MPDQAALLELYGSASPYVVGADAASLLTRTASIGSFDKFAVSILNGMERGRYLEIGAGGGQLMRCARRMGFDCYGVDPGQWVPDPSIKRNLEDWPGELTFNVFLLKDVIEHVQDPVVLLKCLRKRADRRAIAIASFPCCESRPARRYGLRWNMVRPYGHIHYFSRRSACELFERSGWKVLTACMARPRTISQLLSHLEIRALARELIKGGPDQLHVYAAI